MAHPLSPAQGSADNECGVGESLPFRAMHYVKRSREENESLFLDNTGYEGCLW